VPHVSQCFGTLSGGSPSQPMPASVPPREMSSFLESLAGLLSEPGRSPGFGISIGLTDSARFAGSHCQSCRGCSNLIKLQ
jgi:hypothetical protein